MDKTLINPDPNFNQTSSKPVVHLHTNVKNISDPIQIIFIFILGWKECAHFRFKMLQNWDG